MLFRSSDVFQLGSCGVVGGVSAGNDSVLVDRAVSIELLVVFELVVVLEESRTDVVHDLGVVVVSIGELVPVAGHNGSGGVILSLLQDDLLDLGSVGRISLGVGGGGVGAFGGLLAAACEDAQHHGQSQGDCKNLLHVLFLLFLLFLSTLFL